MAKLSRSHRSRVINFFGVANINHCNELCPTLGRYLPTYLGIKLYKHIIIITTINHKKDLILKEKLRTLRFRHQTMTSRKKHK